MRTILLSAAASLMLLGSAAAEGSRVGPFGPTASVHSSVSVNIPAVDTGSEAYPSTRGAGMNSDTEARAFQWNQALLQSPDIGSEQGPPGLR